jgi:hypothetical protein
MSCTSVARVFARRKISERCSLLSEDGVEFEPASNNYFGFGFEVQRDQPTRLQTSRANHDRIRALRGATRPATPTIERSAGLAASPPPTPWSPTEA